MPSFEQLFGSTLLDVVIPDTSLEYPPDSSTDDWLSRLKLSSLERKQAFFDEQLQAFLTVRIEHPHESDEPPQELLSFLSHVQITIEASYISSAIPTSSVIQETPKSNWLSAPPRRDSISPNKSRLSPSHPSIFPPSTPNPTPSTADQDRMYLKAEGTPLSTIIWGQDDSEKEAFTLLWSEKETLWVAVYKLSLTIAFLRLPFTDPLLCLTVSTTLREKPLLQPKILPSLPSQLPTSPSTPTGPTPSPPDPDLFQEFNLLKGLNAGPTFSSASLSLPSSRLGRHSRETLFSLPPIIPPTPTPPTPSPLTTLRTAHPTLRKSFRKTLPTVSGFRVRMRTVFVPSMIEEEDERTVVLCVEVENSAEAGAGVGFQVEKIDVSVSGEGASASLIDETQDGDQKKFPLKVGAGEQSNLLYAVSFLREGEMKRGVNINIFGRPYDDGMEGKFPTETFSSRWNCVLDLANNPQNLPRPLSGELETLPEPLSPFPVPVTPRDGFPPNSTRDSTSFPSLNLDSPPASALPLIGAGKRHTMPSPFRSAGHRLSTPSFLADRRLSTPPRSEMPNRQRTSSLKHSYTPPSISVQIPKSPTTYDEPTLAMPPPPPMTPAYPAFNTPPPPTPGFTTMGVGKGVDYVGPSVDLPRQRNVYGALQTPGPVVGSGAFEQQQQIGRDKGGDSSWEGGGEIVVSIGLLGGDKEKKIYPLDEFTLDIFVFNRGEGRRRFEVGCPDHRKRGRKEDNKRGVIPMENRVRVGPLLPSACQSVRMRFLAILPGIHTIETLTLTDVETGYCMNLRSVMDVAIHETS